MVVCDAIENLDEIRTAADQLAKLPDNARKGTPEAATLISMAAIKEIDI